MRKKVLMVLLIICLFIVLISIVKRNERNSIPEVSTYNPMSTIKIAEKNNIMQIEPRNIEGLLINPGKGLVLRSTYPEQADDAVAVQYARFKWIDLEPEKGKFNWKWIEDRLDYCRKNGKKFAFGVVNASTDYLGEYVTPKWVFDEGAKYYTYSQDGIDQIVPVWTDEIFLRELNLFIEELAKRYDGNELIEFIDIRSYGNYGEQHLHTIGGDSITPEQLEELYIKPYVDNFKKTQLVNPWGEDSYNEVYKSCIDSGIAIRRDGIMKYSNGKEMFEYAYGKVPTIFEFYTSYDKLKEQGLWSEDDFLKYIEEWKPSYVEYWPEMYDDNPELVKYVGNKIGYYFKLIDARHNSKGEVEKELNIEMNYINEGVAPLYEQCTVYIGLLDEKYNTVKKYKTVIDPQKWQPGQLKGEKANIVLNGVEPGKYILSVGLFLNENDEKPTYLLGNTGETDDRWYVLGYLEVENNIEREIIDKYIQLKEKYNNKVELSKNIQTIIARLEEISKETAIATKKQTEECIAMNYSLIDGYLVDEQLLEIIKDIDDIAILYDKLFELNSVTEVYGVEGLNSKIANTEKLMDFYKEKIKLTDIEELYNLAMEHYNENSIIDYFRCENIIDIINKIIDIRAKEYNLKSVKIEYSINTITNQDVEARLVSSSQEIEMPYGDTYTFTENGTFIFKYLYNGEEKEIIAAVNWIDKTYPEFVGINDRTDETEAVTINVFDENLDTVVVSKDGNIVPFNNGDTLVEIGTYVITATDKAGNTTIAELRIIDYIESNKTYYIALDGSGNGLSDNSPMNVSDASKMKYYAGDKILFKAGEKYNIDLNWNMVGSPDNGVTISKYGDGDLPVINGSIELVSNLNISNIKFMSKDESCLITNQLYNENIFISNCVFENVADTAIYLNKQISNINIKDCIFKNCEISGIAIKNDDRAFIAKDIIIQDNIFASMNNAIAVSGDFEEEVFENVQICDNYFIGQIGERAIISYRSIVDTKFDVKVFNNFFYNFNIAYSADENFIDNLKNNLVSENNTLYAVDNSKLLNECMDFGKLQNEYNLEKNSKFVVMNKDSYQTELVEEVASNSNNKNEILIYLLETIRMSNSDKNVHDIDMNSGAVTVTSGYEAFMSSKVGSAAELTSKNSQEKVVDMTVSDEALPLAGWMKVVFVAIAIVLISAVISGAKNAKYWQDTKKQIKKRK